MKFFFLILQIFLTFILTFENEACNERFQMISDLTEEDCGENEYLMPNYNNECFSECVEIPPANGYCGADLPPCPPGYNCIFDGFLDMCVLDENSCFKYYVNYDSSQDKDYFKAMWKPKCLKDGSWAPKQCKGEEGNGRCFCYDAVGNRLHGQEWSHRAENMTCACSRRKAELDQQVHKNFMFASLHCDSMGNYEPLQCSQDNCWCVEPKTGEMTSPAVPMKMMTYLPCWDEDEVGSEYFKWCDSYLQAQNEIKRALTIHGVMQVNMDHLLCAADGGYGPYTISNGIAYCTWRDGSKLGSWLTQVNEKIGQMNCYCAQDSKIFEAEGLKQNLICQENGNYKELQRQMDLLYCVDQDGFQKSELFGGTESEHEKTCENYK